VRADLDVDLQRPCGSIPCTLECEGGRGSWRWTTGDGRRACVSAKCKCGEKRSVVVAQLDGWGGAAR
jgi:hypothetical protein